MNGQCPSNKRKHYSSWACRQEGTKSTTRELLELSYVKRLLKDFCVLNEKDSDWEKQNQKLQYGAQMLKVHFPSSISKHLGAAQVI